MSKVNVYDDFQVIAVVEYNNNLDIFDGSQYSSGQCGHHEGLTKLKTGEFVLITATDYENQQDSACIISDKDAWNRIVETQNYDLFKIYPELKRFCKDLIEEDVRK